MFHSKTLINKINKLHERALCVTYADETSTFDEFYTKEHFVLHMLMKHPHLTNFTRKSTLCYIC